MIVCMKWKFDVWQPVTVSALVVDRKAWYD